MADVLLGAAAILLGTIAGNVVARGLVALGSEVYVTWRAARERRREDRLWHLTPL